MTDERLAEIENTAIYREPPIPFVLELIAEVRRLRAELANRGCYWDADFRTAICPEHGKTIGECPIRRSVITAGPTFTYYGEDGKPLK